MTLPCGGAGFNRLIDAEMIEGVSLAADEKAAGLIFGGDFIFGAHRDGCSQGDGGQTQTKVEDIF